MSDNNLEIGVTMNDAGVDATLERINQKVEELRSRAVIDVSVRGNFSAAGEPGYAGGAQGAITDRMKALRQAQYWQQFESGETDLPYQAFPGQGNSGPTWTNQGNFRNFGETQSFEDAYMETSAGRKAYKYQQQRDRKIQILNARGVPVDNDMSDDQLYEFETERRVSGIDAQGMARAQMEARQRDNGIRRQQSDEAWYGKQQAQFQTADAEALRGEHAGRLSFVNEQFNGNPSYADRQRLMQIGFNSTRMLEDAQQAYDSSVPNRQQRGPMTMQDVHAQALEENREFDNARARKRDDALRRQDNDERWYNADLDKKFDEDYRDVSNRDRWRETMRGRLEGRGNGKANLSGQDMHDLRFKRFDPDDGMNPDSVQDFGTMDDASNFKFGSIQWAAAMNKRIFNKDLNRSIAYGSAEMGMQLLQADTRYTMTGQADPVGMAGAYGALPGAVVGGLVGSAVSGGFGGIIGARVGSQFGSALASNLVASSFAENQMALGNAGYAYSTGQNDRDFVDRRAARSIWSGGLSQSDMESIGTTKETQGWFAAFKETVARGSGMYSGNDRFSDQDEQKVIASIQRMSTERGEVISAGAAKSTAYSFLQKYGQEGLGITANLEKYNAAYQRSGGNTIDIMMNAGVDATLTGLRQSGQNPNAALLTDIAATNTRLQRPLEMAALGVEYGTQQMEQRRLSGAELGAGDFGTQSTRIQREISAITDKIANLLRDGMGDTSKEVTQLRVAREQFITSLAQNVSEAAHYSSNMQGLNNAIGRGDTAISAAGTNLWGGAGSFQRSLLPQQQRDADNDIAYYQNIINSPGFSAEDKKAAEAGLRNAKAQRMMLPSAAQAADIQRGDESDAVTAGQAGLGMQRASLYGSGSDIGNAGGEQLAANSARRERLQRELARPQSASIRDGLLREIQQIDSSDMSIRAGVSSSQYGREAFERGLAGTRAGFGVAQAGAYGSDSDVSGAYGASRATREATGRTLTARLNDPNLPVADRQRIMQQLLGLEVEQFQEGVSQRGNEIGRMETRAGLRQGEAGQGLNRARRLGGATDFRSALGSVQGELQGELEEINQQVSKGGLTFDQNAGLQRRRQGIQQQMFDNEQSGIDEGYSKEDRGGYDVQRLRLGGARQRARMLPFGAGNVLGLDMQQLGQDEGRRRTLASRYQSLSRSGNLSPDRAFALESENQSLMNDEAGILGEMGRGMENYLPGMSAGRPSSSGRWNGLNLAALRFGQMGSPVTAYGFAGGQHQTQVQQFMNSMGMGNVGMGGMAHNRGNVDNMQVPYLERMVQSLDTIARSVGGGRSGGSPPTQRPGEMAAGVGNATRQISTPDFTRWTGR